MKLTKMKSQYKGVTYHHNHSLQLDNWRLSFSRGGLTATKDYPFTDEGERQAAKAYDLKRIEHGKEPVNILKKKV